MRHCTHYRSDAMNKLSTLQNGCFNHGVVTLVADKLKKGWLYIIDFSNCLRQLERRLPRLSYNKDLVVSSH